MSEERPSYFLCSRRDVPALVKRAEAEAAQILKEFGEFYKTAGVLAIEIKPVQYFRGYGISGRLTWDGETVIEESDCGLLFLTLNEVMLNRMLQLGMPSFGKGATQ
ncbi:MAG: hypothetical protein EOM30_01330 [Clostridia bacterium]|nr:hypothetical protein [Clostridia bacterium]